MKAHPLFAYALAFCLFPKTPLPAEPPVPSSQDSTSNSPEPAAPPPKPALSPAPNQQVSISKSSLQREFILSTNIIQQIIAPTSTALASKIVTFELFHDGVDLYESTTGLVVTKDLPSKRLITTFPIISQNDQEIIIDFNAGMRRVFQDFWHQSSVNPALPTSHTLEIPKARVLEVALHQDQLTVRQTAQIRDRQNDQNREERFEIRYFISPYQPSDLSPKEHPPGILKHLRFFETFPQIESVTGRSTTYIARFDIRKPILIRYSSNTPADYENAVKDGILYWNKAFGKDVIQVEKAREGTTAPDSSGTLIQWVPWDNAGFAYADLILDPKTGISQRGQVYLTSTFAFSGRAQARQVLRRLQTTKEANNEPGKDDKEGKPTNFATTDAENNPFPKARTCELNHPAFVQDYSAGLNSALATAEFDENSAKRISQDYVRWVVAHEVGHVLGLRHNFAGSLASTMTPSELNDWFASYLKNDDTTLLNDRITSSSVMEYSSLHASVHIGWRIRKAAEALPYDKHAIRWAYLDQKDIEKSNVPFATDQDINRYGDVNVFDDGSQPILSEYAALRELIRSLPNQLIELYIAEKAPRNPKDARPLEEVPLFPDRYVLSVVSRFDRILSWFNSNRRSLLIERTFPYVGPLNEKERWQAHWKVLNQQFEAIGGVDRCLFSFLPIDWKLDLKEAPNGIGSIEKVDAAKLTERISNLLDSAPYNSFKGLDEADYQFTKEEKDIIKHRAATFFKEFEKLLIKRVCQRLENFQRDLGFKAIGELTEEDLTAKLEKRLIDLSREIILAKDDSIRHRGKMDKALVEVIDFKYDQETRSAAAKILSDTAGSFKKWCTEPRAEIAKQLRETIDSSLNIQNLREFKDSALSRPLREWYLRQQSLLDMFPKDSAHMQPSPAAPQQKQTGSNTNS